MIRRTLHDELLKRLKEKRRFMQVGGQGIPLEEFLSKPAADWLR